MLRIPQINPENLGASVKVLKTQASLYLTQTCSGGGIPTNWVLCSNLNWAKIHVLQYLNEVKADQHLSHLHILLEYKTWF